MRTLIAMLITQSKQATLEQLTPIITQVSQAPFAADLLEADESLWGNFWQGDVIAPGYRLPAVELALLRVTRLDLSWPEGTTVAEFLADLHQAVLDPQAGVWALLVAGEPCVVFASVRGQISSINDRPTTISHQPLATVVWYCATTRQLHAGYRTAIAHLNFEGAIEQRSPVFWDTRRTKNPYHPGHESLSADLQRGETQTFLPKNLAVRLDMAIQRIKANKS